MLLILISLIVRCSTTVPEEEGNITAPVNEEFCCQSEEWISPSTSGVQEKSADSHKETEGERLSRDTEKIKKHSYEDIIYTCLFFFGLAFYILLLIFYPKCFLYVFYSFLICAIVISIYHSKRDYIKHFFNSPFKTKND